MGSQHLDPTHTHTHRSYQTWANRARYCGTQNDPVLGRWRQENQKFKVILRYIMNLRLALATWDPVTEAKPYTVTLTTPRSCPFSTGTYQTMCCYLSTASVSQSSAPPPPPSSHFLGSHLHTYDSVSEGWILKAGEDRRGNECFCVITFLAMGTSYFQNSGPHCSGSPVIYVKFLF